MPLFYMHVQTNPLFCFNGILFPGMEVRLPCSGYTVHVPSALRRNTWARPAPAAEGVSLLTTTCSKLLSKGGD